MNKNARITWVKTLVAYPRNFALLSQPELALMN